MVVCVDQHRWVAKFVGISGLWLGSSALVDCGWVRQHQWVAWVGFVVVDVGVATDQPQTHATDRSACSPIGWVFGEFLFCLVCVEEMKMEIWVFFFFFLAYCGLVVVVLAMADGRGSCGRCCVCFFGSEIYYFIVMFILFYYVEI